MKRSLRRIGLSASVAATMALAGAAPALAQGQGPKVVTGNPGKSQGQGPKLVTGNPPKTTVIHCKRAVPGSRGVIIIKVRKGVVSVKNNCRGVPAGVPVLLPVPLAQQLVNLLPPGPVPGALVPLLPLGPGGVDLPRGVFIPQP